MDNSAMSRKKKNILENNLRYFRQKAELTLDELAEKADDSRENIRRYETGERELTFADAAKLAFILIGIKDGSLMFGPVQENSAMKNEGHTEHQSLKNDDLDANEEVFQFLGKVASMYKHLSADAKALAPDHILPLLKIKPIAQLIIPVDRSAVKSSTASSSENDEEKSKKNQHAP